MQYEIILKIGSSQEEALKMFDAFLALGFVKVGSKVIEIDDNSNEKTISELLGI